ncbi:transcription termination factor MTERF6, chloroplastic/mitochondrial-like isoform X3 [Prunus avium]|uniref:Transcription termination factor MTERF6, chloroplastic/mitochondrial-like isoform X3 n=1 Tax=Prunus avium TaxID=42229 RepID=A0A6P5T9V0_PRUAV|nr:transcription termination factor MTERF6, chloroplastic/mitochondrial-like isoform X3 [Prunus avium]
MAENQLGFNSCKNCSSSTSNMIQLRNLKTFRLVHSIFSCTFASKTNRVLVGDPKPSHFSLQSQLLCRHISSEISEHQHNFTVTYLINTCGLSPEGAILASKWVELQSSERADSVLEFLRNYGASQTQISKLIRSRPTLLSTNPEKTLLPKLEFFSSLEISNVDLLKTLAFNPHLLLVSLRNRILPTYNFLRSMLSEKNVGVVFKHNSGIFLQGHCKHVVPNIGLLRESGMPQPCISFLLTRGTRVLMVNPEKFGQLVSEVKEMGFNLEKSTSVNALRALCGQNKLVLNRSREVLKTWGWSEDDFLSAFRKNPWCMIISEKKLMQAMDLLVNKMGWSSGMIAKYPVALGLSLERRLIPRCSVVKVLLLKGLINENLNLGSLVKPAEKQFLEIFVNRYLGEVPELLSVYQGKVDIQDV